MRTSERHPTIRPSLTSRWVQEQAGRDDATEGSVPDPYLMEQSPHYRKGYWYGVSKRELQLNGEN